MYKNSLISFLETCKKPVRKELREGQHIGEVVKELLKVVPDCTIFSFVFVI